MEHALQVVDLTYSFPGFDFGPVSLPLNPGRIHGLLGPNGAGKTTLLNLITQQLKPASGRIVYDDCDVRWGDPRWKARFSYVRETPAFYDELRVRDVLALASRLYERWDSTTATRLATRLDLDPGKRVEALSKGNRVKLGVAVGLAAQANLLLLDEPTAGLDPTARADVQHTLREIMRDGGRDVCMVLSSHIFEDLERIADAVLVMRSGRVAFRAARDEFDSMVLFRCEGTDDLDVTAARLHWRTTEGAWILAQRGSELATALAHRSDWVEERPRSLLEAVYHGVQRL